MENNEIVLKALKEAGKPLKGGEIATRSGLDKKLVDKSLKALQDSGEVFSPIRCFYDLKK